jgi:hypothetical protein
MDEDVEIQVRDAWDLLRQMIENGQYRDRLTGERLELSREFREFNDLVREVCGG